MKIKDIARICGGKVVGNGEREITGFFTDSRNAEPQMMFVPIKGENADGHKFVPSVFEKGSASFSETEITGGDSVIVSNCLNALQKVAAHHRDCLKIPVVGITGSVGKTTAKEIIALGIEAELAVLKTAGNANSQVGLPLTVLNINKEHEAAVLEMGMSLPGEMERISAVAKPLMAVFTNAGVSHIEFHGSREKIMEEKLSITDFFTKDSILFVNGDDDLLSTLKGTKPYRVLEFGLREGCDFRAVNVLESAEGSSFTCVYDNCEVKMFIPVPGLHNVRNALASLAVAVSLGVKPENAAKSISGYKPPQMRQQIVKVGELTLIDDTYNASPDSVCGAIDVLLKLEGKRKIALLADMLELGAYSKKGHSDVGEYAKSAGVDFLITLGKEAKYIYDSFESKEKSLSFEDYDSALEVLLKELKKGDVLLVKGSRGMRTDRFIQAIKEKGQLWK